jgi:hypothetical protein
MHDHWKVTRVVAFRNQLLHVTRPYAQHLTDWPRAPFPSRGAAFPSQCPGPGRLGRWIWRCWTLTAYPGMLASPLEIARLTGLEFLELGPQEWRVLLDAAAVPRRLLAAAIEVPGNWHPLPIVAIANARSPPAATSWRPDDHSTAL